MSFDHDSQASLSIQVASWQHHGFMHTLVGHGSFSGSGSSTKSDKRPLDDDELTTRATKDDFKEEINLMVAALEACALSRAEAQDAGDRLFASSTNGDSVFEPFRKIANPGPPKRFHRRGALWSSMTRRMLSVARQSPRSTPSTLP